MRRDARSGGPKHPGHAADHHLRRRVGIRGGRRVADFVGQNDRFRGATAEMQVARDNVKEMLLLTSPTLHCYLQKAWLSKGSERESLKALPAIAGPHSCYGGPVFEYTNQN